MSKNIVIIGGGISGLACLHYLNKKYKNDSAVSITLLEKDDFIGGTIRTLSENNALFETGPNGFINSRVETLEFLQDLGLLKRLIQASPRTNRRFISLNDFLYPIPADPFSFIMSNLLSPLDKWKIIRGLLSRKKLRDHDSVYDYFSRFGKKTANLFADSFVRGIYAGNARDLNMKEAFPQIAYKSKRDKTSVQKIAPFLKRGKLTSFSDGMTELMNMLFSQYKNQIMLGANVENIEEILKQFHVKTKTKTFYADQLFISTPAYVAAKLLKSVSLSISNILDHIEYAPVVLTGFMFNKSDFKKLPEGFGYLIPSTQQKYILGVLFENNVFPNRCPKDKVLLRVMMGGVDNAHILQRSKEELIKLAYKEVIQVFKITSKPTGVFFKVWSKAIPQYNQKYVGLKARLFMETPRFANFKLVANYIGGVSFNDCIKNARTVVEQSSL